MTLRSKTNIFFYFSIALFIATCVFYTHTKHTIAIGVGSGGGRIAATLMPVPLPCVPQICACNVTFFAALAQYGGTVSSICFPLANVPNAGPPLTVGSIGMQVLGYFSVTDGVMVSSNWGTSI